MMKGCKVIYDGLFSGEEFIKYCQTCHVGLSTQNMEGKYLESSFPSKILSYLGMGLNVVSGAIDCVSQSKISQILTIYHQGNAEAIAFVIKNLRIKNTEKIKKVIENLHLNFVSSLTTLIKIKL